MRLGGPREGRTLVVQPVDTRQGVEHVRAHFLEGEAFDNTGVDEVNTTRPEFLGAQLHLPWRILHF